MNREPSKEAKLREVLAEVSLADVGEMLKSWLSTMGCLSVFMVVLFVFIKATDSIGFTGSNIPNWVWWPPIAWLYVYQATSTRSYHQWSWYFPKLGWFGSLILTAYLVGFIYLLIWIWHMDTGLIAGVAFFAVWCGYTAPFTAFVAVTSLGHTKLMEKRHGEVEASQHR